MLQFSQALLYEEHHLSPLSEMLIERALKNPYVVGHSLYWTLKSNLYLKVSYERYFVILEQFLMLCGRFLETFIIQTKVNECLRKASETVVAYRYGKGCKVDECKGPAKIILHEQRNQLLPLLYTTAADPKYVIRDWCYKSLIIFNSAKVPLLVKGINHLPGCDSFSVIFKNGDDLRQDILTLQIIQIMDRIWLDNKLDLAMTPYKVVGTNCEQGFVEFVGDTTTLAKMQYIGGLFNTFDDDTVEKYMTYKIKQWVLQNNEEFASMKYYPATKENEDEKHLRIRFIEPPSKDLMDRFDVAWKERLEKVRKVFIKSTAGYCVASYVLGLGDRHPDNIMINHVEGNFLHIDFGHFLGHKKWAKFKGVELYKRERDPFVFTPDIAYFVNGKSMFRVKEGAKQPEKKSVDVSMEEHKENY